MRTLCSTTAVLAVLCLAAPAAPAAELPDGQYEFTIYAGAGKSTYCIVKIEKKDDKLTAAVTAAGPQMGAAGVNGLTQSADGLRFNLALRNGAGQFVGAAGDEKGSRGVFTSLGRTMLARLEPTTATTLPARAEVTPDQRDLTSIMAEKDAVSRVEKLRQFAASHAESPFVFEAYRLTIAGAKQAGLDAKSVAAVADDYAGKAAAWSPKWHQETLLSIATSLTQAELLPELALKHLDAAKSQLGRNPNALAQRAIELASGQALMQLGRFDDAEKVLEQLHARVPTDQEATFRLGQVQEKTGKLDAAIETWLPIFASRNAFEPLRAAWQKKHGNLNNFAETLDKIYHKNVPPLDVPKFAGRQSKSANGVVLMELFTGAMCPPCVAADVAFDALVGAYQPSEVVFLEYHMHIPGPDPMTNPDAETRFKYYAPDARGTPATFFNGKSEGYGGGGLANARAKFDQYRAAIDPKLEATTNGSLKLRVFGDGDSIKIETEVSGLAGEDKPLPGNLKLRLALVEDLVRYPGSNGMWQSHRVVRGMPGGADGIAIKKDNFTDTEVVMIGDVRQTLATYVNDYETNVAKSRQYTFPDKPFKLEKLKVIAFVQDDATKEVLLAAEAAVGE